MGRFDGSVVWITGAGSGLGRYCALEFARQGADVALSGRRRDRLEQVAAEVEALGRRAGVFPCDVSDEAAVAQTVDTVIEAFGKLDVVVANAGFGVGGYLERHSAADWRRQFDVNVVGAAMTAKYAVPALRETQGRLVLIGSVSARVHLPGNGPYQASKAAVMALGATLSAELAPEGVSCTTIHPGFVESEIAQVDNNGTFHPDRKDSRPQQLMWKTDDAARVMVDAIYRRKRDFTFTGHGRFATFLARFAPWLIHLSGTRMAAAEAEKRRSRVGGN